MINIKKHIGTCEVSFDTKKIISTLPHVHASDTHLKLNVPFDFTFNENWTLSHTCNCENGRVSFSKTKNWHFLSRLFSKFYEDDFLESLALAFDSLRVFESSKSNFMFLTKVEFNDDSAPIYRIPQVYFNYYTCDKCKSQYLCRLTEGGPLPADRRMQKGREGLLIIHEVVQFELFVEGEFLSILRKYTGGEG